MIFEVFLRVEEGAMRASKPMKLGRNSQKATQNPERFHYNICLVTFQNSFLLQSNFEMSRFESKTIFK